VLVLETYLKQKYDRFELYSTECLEIFPNIEPIPFFVVVVVVIIIENNINSIIFKTSLLLMFASFQNLICRISMMPFVFYKLAI
jgi:hypothetical protein